MVDRAGMVGTVTFDLTLTHGPAWRPRRALPQRNVVSIRRVRPGAPSEHTRAACHAKVRTVLSSVARRSAYSARSRASTHRASLLLS